MINQGIKYGLTCIVLTLLLSFNTQAQTEKVDVFFENFKSGVFNFEAPDGMEWEFSVVPADLVEKFKLKSKENNGKAFSLTYNIEYETDEDDFETEVYSIISMKPIQLERQVEEDDEEWED